MCLDKDKQTSKGIEITPAMIEAGMDALREYHLGDDMSYVIEMVYRAMHHENLSASDKKSQA